MYLTMSMMTHGFPPAKKKKQNTEICLKMLSQVMLHLSMVHEDMAATPVGQVYGEDLFPHSTAKWLILAQQKITGGDCG